MTTKLSLAKNPRLRELKLTLSILGRNPSAVAGAVIILFMLLLALSAGWLAPYDPIRISLGERLAGPSSTHWFGTDEMGRDILTRVMYGARISLRLGLVIVFIAGVTGSLIGAVSGYFGRRTDNIIMRVMDVILSFPSLVLAMALAAALGPSLNNAILAVAFVMIPKFARMVRGEALAVREMPFIAAARVSGARHYWIILHHLLPNCVNSVIVLATLTLGDTILIAAGLSFIGLGAQPPTPEWGRHDCRGQKIHHGSVVVRGFSRPVHPDHCGGFQHLWGMPCGMCSTRESGADEESDRPYDGSRTNAAGHQINLSLAFDTYQGRAWVLDNVSLAVRPGEVLGLVGETGCGKSVCAKTILRLLPEPPARILGGSILFHGKDLLRISPKTLRRIRGQQHFHDFPGTHEQPQSGFHRGQSDDRGGAPASGRQSPGRA